MKKNILVKPIWLLITVLIWSFIVLTSPIIAAAETKEVDIETSAQEKFLIRVTNLKPGDWIPRDLIIYNKGNKDFKYTTTIENASTDKMLYKELKLEVKVGTQVLYSGLLKDFNGLAPRYLAKGTQETVNFTVYVPYELGNIYQNTDGNFDIKLVAEEINSGNPDPNPNPNPDPGNPNPNPDPENPEPKPENPENPDPNHPNPDPSNPEKPGSKPGKPNDGSGISDELPNTATNLYNLLTIGGVVTSIGLTAFFVQRHRAFNKWK